MLLFVLLAFADGVTLDGNRLVLPSPVRFDGTMPTSDSAPALDAAASFLQAKISISLVRVEGHTEPVEGAQALSEARAMAVSRALVARGVDCKRLLPVGFGDTKPVAENTTPEGRDQNRRIELVNAMLLGRAIGGMPVDGGGRVAGDPCGG